MKTSIITAVAAAFSTFAFCAHAQQAGIELGLLDCQVEGGTGFIIGSTKA